MKKSVFIFVVVVFFSFLISLEAQVVDIQWNTFLGSSEYDLSYGIALNGSGNVYVTGSSASTWGSPINAHSGSSDAYVACVNSSGSLQWNTFLGSGSGDYGYGIALDSTGNIYVAGCSDSTWGSPVSAHSGFVDAFVACLNSSGSLIWHTFLGSVSDDKGRGIALDSSGNVYMTGESNATWGSPINAYSGGKDTFVACLNGSGSLLWSTFLGSFDDDYGRGIVVDSSGNVLVTGYSNNTWGMPLNAHNGLNDAFVARINSSGNLVWHTFLGSAGNDAGWDVALDGSGNIFIAGFGPDTWGSPINAHSGGVGDAFVAVLDSSGNLSWNTFLGSNSGDSAYDIALDGSGNIYVTGYSDASWGSPVHAYSGSLDILVACLSNSGSLLWNTFMGSNSSDEGNGIALDSSGNVCVIGHGVGTWGTPINAHSGNWDGSVAKLSTHPVPDIIANGSAGPISITVSDTLKIRVSLNRFGSGENVDYWLAYKGPSGWIHYNNSTKKWETGLGVTHQGPLMDLNNKKVYQKSGLAPGNYTFYFGVDMNMDGKVTKSSLYKDEVQVTVTQ